tara:strand:- start:411 stop:632 length:222 start_codon:yes stop_codon:yes gene_type:complete
MYRFICETKNPNGKISTVLVESLEHDSLRFRTEDEAWYFYQEWFDGRELHSWNPTYNEDGCQYRIVIKHVDNV